MHRFLLIALAVGCGPGMIRDSDSPGGHVCFNGTGGQSGVACFAWRSTSDLTTPIAAGSSSIVEVASEIGWARVESSSPAIAGFELAGSDIEVLAFRPGAADLILVDAMGREIDRATVVVAENAALGADVYGGATHVAVLAGVSERFHVSTVGPNGEGTVGVGAVTFSSAGMANLSSLFFKDGDETGFWGWEGRGSVVARAGAASAVLDVDFLGESAVDSVDLRVGAITPRLDGTAEAVVTAVAQTASGPLYGATCRWTTSPVATVSQGVYGLDRAAGSETRLVLDQPGRTYAATCAIGSRSATVNVRY